MLDERLAVSDIIFPPSTNLSLLCDIGSYGRSRQKGLLDFKLC